MNDAFEAISGVKVVALVFGFIGAALGISYTPEMTKRTAFAAMIAGIVCGGLGPEVASAMWGTMPAVMKNVIALVCGIGGMFIVPGFIAIWKGFAADPWGFIDRIRGQRKSGGNDGGQS